MQLSRPKWFAVVFCLVILLLVLFSTRSRNDLLSKANRLAITRGVITNELTYSGYHFFYHHVPSYSWLSDTTLLYIHEIKRGSHETVQIDLAAETIEKHAGRGPLDQSQGLFDKTFYWAASPDGQWMLSISKAGEDLVYTARTFDSAREVAWTNRFESGVQPAWLNDSTGFVEWPLREGVGYARVHWLDTGKINEINIDNLHAESPKGKKFESFAAVAPKMWVDGSAAEFIELKRQGDSVIARRYSLPPPNGLARGEVTAFPSPRGDRLAWVFYLKRKFPSIGLQRRDPYFVVEPVFSTVVCLSGPDGGDMRVIGRLQPGLEISRMAWTPDARRLSFVCDNALWTVSAD